MSELRHRIELAIIGRTAPRAAEAVMAVLAEQERAEPDAVPRSRELRSQLYKWLGNRTSKFNGEWHDHDSLRKLADELAQRIEQLPMPIEDKLAEILRAAGIEYPLGLRGVRDLVNQRDGHLERAREAEDLVSRTHEAMMIKYAEAGQLRERAEEAERRLANVREMVTRLRHAEPVGSASAGYCLVRIEDMLNGQELT